RRADGVGEARVERAVVVVVAVRLGGDAGVEDGEPVAVGDHHVPSVPGVGEADEPVRGGGVQRRAGGRVEEGQPPVVRHQGARGQGGGLLAALADGDRRRRLGGRLVLCPACGRQG